MAGKRLQQTKSRNTDKENQALEKHNLPRSLRGLTARHNKQQREWQTSPSRAGNARYEAVPEGGTWPGGGREPPRASPDGGPFREKPTGVGCV